MPIPKPKEDEKESMFITRCMTDEVMKREYPDSKQRVAVCYQTWRESKKNNDRGDGQGVGKDKVGDGGVITCTCPNCNYSVRHERNIPCTQMKCPKCDSMMIGK